MYDAWHDWATGIQDDHGFVATTLERLPRASRKRRRRRRAMSLPPPITLLDEFTQVPAEGDAHLFQVGRMAGSREKGMHGQHGICNLDGLLPSVTDHGIVVLMIPGFVIDHLHVVVSKGFAA